mmetsp:Transcript_27093/g.46053  ORF Transcript_27093/g.46053 Transcript_27093/m.46053 type:complete len:125 (-) Transcript_27093:2788-3162(-)
MIILTYPASQIRIIDTNQPLGCVKSRPSYLQSKQSTIRLIPYKMQAQAHVIPYSRPAASTTPPLVESTKCHLYLVFSKSQVGAAAPTTKFSLSYIVRPFTMFRKMAHGPDAVPSSQTDASMNQI